MSAAVSSDDLFFNTLIQRYIDKNPRFLRRDWLAKQLDEKLREPGKRFLLLTAEPGTGKTAFMAQLAHDHPNWLRYFIRRDQREVLADVSDKSGLLRIGYQLAARHPELFSKEQLRVSVSQRIGQVVEGGEAVGAEVKKLTASPFYQKIIQIEQHVRSDQGKVIGLRVEELVIEPRSLSAEDLLCQALIDPALALSRINPKEQIVILIDALDEIHYHATAENILAWLTGCPELPENIRFVLTSRPPDEALRLFCEKQSSRLTQLPIAESDPHVQRDIRQFVTHWVYEPAVAQAIQEAEGNPETFATNAAAKAHGNLGYVDALARAIDLAIHSGELSGLQALLSLKELPSDLERLYAFFLRHIKEVFGEKQIVGKDSSGKTYATDAWPAVYEPILGVLAVAMEPLQVDLIAKLGNIALDLKWVRPAINRLAQFLDVIDGRYRLYHATVAEFLTAEKTRDHPDPDTAALYLDAVSQHRQIADHYWQYRDDWTKCDSYGLRNLAAHLDRAEQVDRLHGLITNAWIQARVSDDGYRYSGFIADVMLAWERAHTEADRQIESNDAEFSAFATCFRYALIRTSINSVAARYPQELVMRALETQVWSFERVLDLCRQVPDEARRFQWYWYVLKFDHGTLSNAQRQSVELAAQSSAQALDGDEARAEALIKLSPQLSGIRKSKALNEALSLAKKIDDERERAKALTALAPQLDGIQIEVVFSMATAIKDKHDRAVILTALIPRLSGSQKRKVLNEALATTRAIENEWSRAEVLMALAMHLSGEGKSKVMDAAVEAIQAVNNVGYRMTYLTSLVPRLSGSRRRKVLNEALETTQVLANESHRAEALTELVPQLSGPRRRKVLNEALETTQALVGDWLRVEALTKLAQQLSGGQKGTVLDEALATTLAIETEWSRAEALKALAPHLSGRQVEVALAAAQTIKDKHDRALVLTALVPQLSGARKGTVLDEALATTLAIESEWSRAETLKALAPQLSGKQSKAALAIMTGNRFDETCAQALAMLSWYLTREQKAKTLNEALTTALAIESEWSRAEALKALAPHLSGRQVQVALAAAQTIKDKHDRALVLTALIPQLSGAQKNKVVNETFAITQEIESEWPRAETLTALVPQLNGAQKNKVVNELLDVVRQRKMDEQSRAEILTILAPQLNGQQIEVAFDVISGFRSEWRAWVLGALAPRLRGVRKTKVLSEALTSTKAGLDYARVRALIVLAPQLNHRQVREALAAAKDIPNKHLVLAALAPRLTGGQVYEVLDVAKALNQTSERLIILFALAAHTGKTDLLKEIRHCLLGCVTVLDHHTRADLLSLVVSMNVLHPPIIGIQTLATIAQHIVEIDERWRWV